MSEAKRNVPASSASTMPTLGGEQGLNRYLTESGAPHASLAALIEFNKAHATEEMRFFGQEIFEQAQAKGPLTEPAYAAARDKARRLAGPEGIVAALKAQQLDALVARTQALAAAHGLQAFAAEHRFVQTLKCYWFNSCWRKLRLRWMLI